MICTPKAIDFEAFQDGEPLPWNHPAGLAARWAIVRRLPALDMLRLTAADFDTIDQAIQSTTFPEGITVAVSASLAALKNSPRFSQRPTH